ncbi:divalent-cation tolerance protein CutA [Leptolyngbya sp. FACHB-261]|uniref:divalent-cation tolerance protein CutA n=1 Tax=Leptolyngbya sp. FACHB-261 TaxID=2692806 RepID=UPI0028C3DFD5|nr:divalent-cation tolerance protein CutA [Leptolyngbya sp. FACHB-261]
MVLTTVPEVETAQTLAETLVTEKLAACVQVLPAMTSTYCWQGKLEVATEHLILVKTLRTRYAQLEARLKALHPYAEPEVVALSATAVSASYLAWAMASLQLD